ncbi:MAG: NAD-dependent epimerase/dehydratase family protein, partial [Firmicutes bacterium]|nr:NAD-dependent epimerase/dehydratase family protein [Bacillota bacterium]
LQWREPTDEVSLYTYNKMLLEKEIAKAAESYDFKYTILRPAMIYGPYNYAPRESWYIEQIMLGEPIPHPVDADGKFQMVYGKDVARAIMLCIEKEEAKDNTFILSAPEVLTYDTYVDLLRTVSDRNFQTTPVTVEEVLKNNIPLPFPLISDENALFNGQKIVHQLGFEYGDLKTYMQLTYNAFKAVFE